MFKQVLYREEAREKTKSGINKIVDAIAVTLGPLGRNVIIARADVIDYGVRSYPLHITKDGVTVARSFELEDTFEKVGVVAVKEATSKTVYECGDGTTTTAVLLRAIYNEGLKQIESGANPMELKIGIEKAVEYVVEQLKSMSTPIKGNIERIKQIATISANNDSSIGNLIAEAFEKIGDEGVIDLEASGGNKTEIKVADGYKFEKSWVHPYFITNKEKQTVELIDPLILLYENKITHHTQVIRAVEICMQQGKPLLIVCEDADEEGLAFLLMNNAQKRISVCVVKSPFGSAKMDGMEDLATVTGATYMMNSKGTNVKEIELAHFGTAKKVLVTKDETVIIGGGSNKKHFETVINELRMNLAQAKTEDEKEPIEKRIAQLKGGVAVIRVGGTTDTEMKEKLDRFDDAVRATKSAIAEGFVVGSGTIFHKIKFEGFEKESIDVQKGIDIISIALSAPLSQIVSNTGKPLGSILPIVQESKDNCGYNAKTDKIENLLESGVIDPTKVLRCSLQNAASAASMLLTSECIIADSVNS